MRKRRWEQRFNIRPAQRSMASRPRRARYTQSELDAEVLDALKAGTTLGRALERHELPQVEQDGDDLLNVAEAAGATPLVDVDGEQMVDELERWLRDQGVDG